MIMRSQTENQTVLALLLFNSMRYLITFRSYGEDKKRTKRVPQQAGEELVRLLAGGKDIVVNGEFYNSKDIESIRKINAENFGKDFAAQQQRLEMNNPEEVRYLRSIGVIIPQIGNAQ